MNRTGRKVAIITGGSQGIGASLVAACRRRGWGRAAEDGCQFSRPLLRHAVGLVWP